MALYAYYCLQHKPRPLSHPEHPPPQAFLVTIDEHHEAQRLDNFLTQLCKGVPKSHVFRIIRDGQVRVNKGRAQAHTKLQVGDVVRVPPLHTKNSNLATQLTTQRTTQPTTQAQTQHTSHPSGLTQVSQQATQQAKRMVVLFEDDALLIINKPSGIAVHGGSGNSLGVIETLRLARQAPYLELAHRLDRETSGVLVLAKKRSALRALQEDLRARRWKKHYQTLVLGNWPQQLGEVKLPLLKTQASQKEARVFVSEQGDSAHTRFKILNAVASPLGPCTLLEAELLTGRTHQIRVHTSSQGYPIAGDDRYGNFTANKSLASLGLKRMFLHAARLGLKHPGTQAWLRIDAPLNTCAPDLHHFFQTLVPANP